MKEHLFTLIPLDPTTGTPAPGLILKEASTRLMALAGRDSCFFRTGAWLIHLVTPQKPSGEPDFESSLSRDTQARAAIMREVCEHGLGLYRLEPDKQFHRERKTVSLPRDDTAGRSNHVVFFYPPPEKPFSRAVGWALRDFGQTYAAIISVGVDIGSKQTTQMAQNHLRQSSKSETWKPRLSEYWRQERVL
jgi:hypothetical protein